VDVEQTPTGLKGLRAPLTIALLYLAFGAVWIFFTDRLVAWLSVDPAINLKLQTSKGWLFVLGSAALLYALLRHREQRNDAVLAALMASQKEVHRMSAELEQRVAERTRQLEAANRELESFVYAVSHDLRAPLRSLSGFSQILRDSASTGLDEQTQHYLRRIQESSQRMSTLIEDLLGLSRISRSELTLREVDLSHVCAEAAAVVRERYPGHTVKLVIEPGLTVHGDSRLLRIAMENLLDNAWKYTGGKPQAEIEVGVEQHEHERVYFVKDNGVGFDMAYAGRLFGPFQRLHNESQFPGTGIGLVTVQRILARLGGRIWAEAEVDRGATFYFTVGK
jgi:light-regulated signal transduction histidine kinase (bacteriophytochrome)